MPMSAHERARRSLRQAVLRLQLSTISGDMVNPAIGSWVQGHPFGSRDSRVIFESAVAGGARDAAAARPELRPLTAAPEELLRCGNMICLSYPKHLCPALAHQSDTVRG